MSLEEAIEYVIEGEAVEVTPDAVRMLVVEPPKKKPK